MSGMGGVGDFGGMVGEKGAKWGRMGSKGVAKKDGVGWVEGENPRSYPIFSF